MIGVGAPIGLVGRERHVKEIVAALDDASGFGAMIVGEAGVGKTAVARAVVEHLRWSAPVLRVTGGTSLRNIPFGALAPYLHTLSVADADSPVAILRAVMSHLSAEKSRSQRPPLIVVDDAHELDTSSSALLAQLVSARRAKVLVLTRTGPSLPPEFVAFSADGLLARSELHPLGVEAVAELCATVLNGPVLTGTSHTLAMVTGGNPMFLLTLLEQGRTEGYLEQRNGVWRLADEQPVVNLRLGDLIRSQLRSRSEDEVEALEVVALAEPIALDALALCVDAVALKGLRDDRLVTVGPAPDQPVSLEQPLYGEVLRSQVPAARSLEIRRRVLAVLEPGAQSLKAFLRTVSWGLECGVPADDRTLLRAAAVANALRDHGFALRAARAVSAPGLRGRALTEIARVQAGRSNVGYAQELVGEALRRCTDLRVAKDVTLLSFELKLKTGASYEDLREDVDRWRSLIATLDLRDGVRVTEDEVFRARLGIRILEAHVLILEGHLSGVEEELRDIMAEPRGSAETRLGGLILLGEVLGSMGRSVEGSTCSGEALAIIEAEGATLLGYREFAAARHVFLLTNSGRAAEAKDVLRTYSRTHPRSIVYFAGWGDFVDGIGALRAGRNRQARDRFLLALEALRDSDVTQVMTLLLGLTAYACALAGDTPRAEALIIEFERTPRRGSRSMRLGGHIFVTATAALLGETPGARADLLSIAATAEKEGFKELAGTALRLSLLLGDLAAVPPIIRVLESVEGSGAADLLDFALAARAKNAEAMVSAATIAGEHGNAAFEFAGLSLALQLMGEQGATRQARSIQRRVVTLGEQREGPVPTPLASVSPAASTPRLTPTERRIVDLVREGYSNREIADAKSVSVRTVEGHLYRIFAKLGVNRREDLRDS
ncbi:AAA family ATPase [Arthrobacter sp. KR32]|uniref:AAA family ATPase n=1 Tax=Arthrobacter bussei TaxID=2594179 RepID=A0A7X1NR24_9MICC|nr:AAA family ATPase [Arthrobacter bussei]